jgi:hypothetical protein
MRIILFSNVLGNAGQRRGRGRLLAVERVGRRHANVDDGGVWTGDGDRGTQAADWRFPAGGTVAAPVEVLGESNAVCGVDDR